MWCEGKTALDALVSSGLIVRTVERVAINELVVVPGVRLKYPIEPVEGTRVLVSSIT
jgi:hypothetical protein